MIVTGIITCHNYADLVTDAITSFHSQDYQQKRLIVIDDGSTDDSRKVIEEMARSKKPPCETYVYFLEQSRGVTWCKNFGIEQTWGATDLFAFLDADDLYLPGKLSKSVEVFKDNKMKIGLVYTDEKLILPHTGSIITKYKPSFVAEKLNEYDYIGANYVVSRRALEVVGRFDNYFELCENYELARRIAHSYLLVHVAEQLVTVRTPDQALRVNRSLEDWEFFLTQARAREYGKTQTQQ